MAQLLHTGMTVVDVGAHVGIYSFLSARLVGPHGIVHAVEPQQECVSIIERNAALNRLPQVKAHTMALADQQGSLGLVVDQRTLGGRTVTAKDAEGRTVAAKTLDAFVREQQVGAIDLLKLDAAGNELAVLRGARSLLEGGAIANVICKLYHPDVIAERFGTVGAPGATADLLSRCGYRVELPSGKPADDEELNSLFAAGGYSVPARRGGNGSRP